MTIDEVMNEKSKHILVEGKAKREEVIIAAAGFKEERPLTLADDLLASGRPESTICS